jgi:thiopeptide-type bacteriocin biosynthesis protein
MGAWVHRCSRGINVNFPCEESVASTSCYFTMTLEKPPIQASSTLLESERAASLIRLVLDSFRAHDLERWCLNHKVSFEEFSVVRSTFISAGITGLSSLRSGPRWTQINITLDDKSGQWEQLMGGKFQDGVRQWLAADSGRAFFFVNKSPGLRLRVLTSQEAEIAPITDLLTEMLATRSIISWTLGTYEPEVFQFGGELGVALTHNYFTVESLTVMAFQRSRLKGESRMRDEQFSILMIDMLLRSVVEDEMEVWDVWCQMELTGRLDRAAIKRYSADSAGQPVQRRLRDQLRELHFGGHRIAEPEGAFFESYRSQIPAIAGRLRQLDQSGQLLWSVRHILPFWIIFHWNRMRFSLNRQRQLSRYMLRLYSPKLISAK